MVHRLLWLLLVACMTAGAQPAETVHVAVDGNDDWTGQQARPGSAGAGPLRTLAAAQRAARKVLAQQGGTVQVLIQPGMYQLSAPLRFGPADSGKPGQPTVYRASQPGTVQLSGGLTLAPIATASGQPGAAFSPPPGADAAFWAGGPQLFVNGRRAVLARQPNAGSHWFAGAPVAVAGEPPNATGHEAFQAGAPALDFVRRLNADDRARALVHVMQSWSSGRHRLATGAPADALRLQPRSRWPFLFFGTSQRYWVENVTASFDAPGEWIGTPNAVRYLPRPDDKGAPTAVVPMLQQLVQISGDGPDGPLVQHLELRDLGFQYTRSPTPLGGWVDSQAAVDIGAAIEVDHARDVRITGCTISATGGHAIWLRQGVRDSEVSGCTMADLGGGAVKIGDPNTKQGHAGGSNATGRNTVRNNRISQTGRQYPGAVAVWVGASFDNLVSHNSISDTTYTAISVGWQWGYGGPSAGRNRIEANALEDIGGHEMADLGGIYTLGVQPGTVISNNMIREVRGYTGLGAGAWGIYNDEGSSDMRVEGNVVVGTDSGGYHLHFGRNLQVQDNLFALGDTAEVNVTRSEPGQSRLVLRNNLVVTRNASPFVGAARTPGVEFSGNLVAAVPPARPVDLQACGGGCSASTASLAMGDAAGSLRLEGLDADRAQRWQATAATAGVQANVARGAMANAALPTAPSRRSAPAAAEQAPALQMALSLRDTPDRLRPPGWRYMPTTPPEAMATVSDPAAPGGRCLQIADGPGFAQRYEPFLFTTLNHVDGSSTASFAVRVDDTTELLHEWRDDAQPFRIGPSLRISRAGLQVAGRVVAPVQPGSWMQVWVRATLASGGTWDLQVTDAGGKVHNASGLPPKTAGWQGLRWLGFIADAAVDSRACLADVKVTNGPAR